MYKLDLQKLPIVHLTDEQINENPNQGDKEIVSPGYYENPARHGPTTPGLRHLFPFRETEDFDQKEESGHA